MATTPGLFSIGHSNHEWGTFLALLRQHAIAAVADVRSFPQSRFVPIFNRDNLEKALAQAGVHYLFFGKELGGRPAGDEFYDGAGHVLYSLTARTPLFLEGINRLEEVSGKCRVALLCSEEDPCRCHRHLLVGKVCHERGLPFWHIRGDRTLVSEAELRTKEVQPMLFQELADQEWRSLKPLKDRARFQEEE